MAVTLLAAVAAFATVLTVLMPVLSRDRLNSRMQVMATERDRMRAARLADLARKEGQGRLRTTSKGFMQDIVDRLQRRSVFDSEEVRDKLKMAGQERRQAYENLGKRTGIPGVKAVATALIQAERYGTPVGQALRVMAKENRDMRMSEAEKKAAALPPKLTVPMILIFLPVLFVVILGPAMIQVFELN